jgi:hypothetical protein
MPDDNRADEAFKRLMEQAAEAIAKSEEYLALLDNPGILKYLKQHPDEFTRIAALPQAGAVEELKKLALACRPKIISSAPRPPTPLTHPNFVVTAPRFASPSLRFDYGDFPERDQAKVQLAIHEAVQQGMASVEGIVHVMRAYLGEPNIGGVRPLATKGIWSFSKCCEQIDRFLRFLAISQRLAEGVWSTPSAKVKEALESMPEYATLLRSFARKARRRHGQPASATPAAVPAEIPAPVPTPATPEATATPPDELPQETDAPTSPLEDKNRRAAVDGFILRCRQETPVQVIRTHIWLAAGHKTARQFQRWQASDPKATKQDDDNFRRILAMKPADFVGLLKNKGVIPSDPK